MKKIIKKTAKGAVTKTLKKAKAFLQYLPVKLVTIRVSRAIFYAMH